MRKIIETDQMEEPVKRFFGGLEVSNEASVVELAGRRVYLVVRAEKQANEIDIPWTDEHDRRRHELIDLRIDSRLTPLESVELAELEEAFDRYLNRIAPLPIDYARDLLRKAQHAIAPSNEAQ